MKKGKGRISTVILILVFLVGLGLLLYPTVSDYWNSRQQFMVIHEYDQQVEDMEEDQYEKLWADAQRYNEALRSKANRYAMTANEQAQYQSLLNLSEIGVMGYIEIPVINCSLPIYHGTEEKILQIAIGHIAGSSLPVGGTGTHCLLSGHRGLPSARLFTDLDKLVVGDYFCLRVLGNTLTYEVDQILIVEPDQVGPLDIDPEQDYCTLITCTPYGINTHRLLVRGHRVENRAEKGKTDVSADAVQIEPILVAPIIAIPILLVTLIVLLAPKRKRILIGDEADEDLFEEEDI